MEKYGVNTEPTEDKLAEHPRKDKCPKCDTPLKDSGETGVTLCPNCGSEPFEVDR